jgi:hypothetical protein
MEAVPANPRRGGCRTNDRKKSTSDGDTVFLFADLALAEQKRLRQCNRFHGRSNPRQHTSTVDLILDNILEV